MPDPAPASPAPAPAAVPERFTAESLRRLVTRVAERVGVPSADAARFAGALVNADEQGNGTHGVSRLAIYTQRIRRGLIDPRAELKVERAHGSVLVLDAGNGLGHVQALKALDLLQPLARAHGVAAATVRRSQHFGTLSYYCNRMAAENMILFATTNCEPAMSPEGGCQAYFGTNPIAASFPTGLGFPVKVDLASSLVARGNIIAAAKQGKPIPSGWALDPAGEPTTDAKAALEGTVLPLGGHKGYALALMVEALSGVLSGAAVGSHIGSMYKHLDRPQDVGHFFCLFDIGAFLPPAEFTARMDHMVGEIKACRRRPGVSEILVPGERSRRITDQARVRGIPVPPVVVDELRGLCAELGVEPGLERAGG